MLADTDFVTQILTDNPICDVVDNMNGCSEVNVIDTGFWNGGINFGNRIDWEGLGHKGSYDYEFPDFGPEYHALCPPAEEEDDSGWFCAYGVCDSPEQFISLFRDTLEADERTFVVSFAHIKKKPENAGKGGGWRWHKWGPYIGSGKPEYEYLDDEDGFDDGVCVYHVYQVAGPILKTNYRTGELIPLSEHEANLKKEEVNGS